jgi:NADPH:quinone reductase-like Zn-dependent oxidoreductase
VHHLAPGAAAFGLAHGCLGTAVLGNAEMLAALPPGFDHSEAATLPTVAATVEVALGQVRAPLLIGIASLFCFAYARMPAMQQTQTRARLSAHAGPGRALIHPTADFF